MSLRRQILTGLWLLAFCGAICAADVNGPIAHWTFDEGSGTTAYDSAGDNDGNLVNGPTWTTGQINGALSFDGSNDYVDVGTGVMDFSGDTSFTATAWIRAQDIGAQNYFLGTAALTGWYARIGGSDGLDTTSLFFKIDDGTDDAYPVETSTKNIADNAWHFVAVSINGLEMKGYVDCDLEFTVPYSGVGDMSDDLNIGLVHNNAYFNGAIDDVRIYDRALSAEEIEELYLEGVSAYARAVNNIKDALEEKQEALIRIDAAIEKEEAAQEALNEMLASGDYGDLDKRSIFRANRDVRSAVWYEKWSTDVLEKSIKQLECSLTALGWEPNLVAHWKLDEGNGDTAYDSAGDNDGTIYGATWTSGKIKGALSFDDANGYVTVGSPATLDDLPLNNMTVCAWIRDEISSGYPWRAITSCYAYNHGWSFRTVCDANGERSLNFEAPHSSGQYDKWAKFQSSYGTIVPNTWQHVAAVWNANTKTAKLYIDGAEPSYALTQPGVGFYNSDASRDKEIGRIPHVGGGQYFRGKIDDVRIYNTALTTEEIRRIYHEGKCKRRCAGR